MTVVQLKKKMTPHVTRRRASRSQWSPWTTPIRRARNGWTTKRSDLNQHRSNSREDTMATDTTKADAIRAMREDGLPEKFNRIKPNAKASAETEAKSPKVKAAAKAKRDGAAKKPAAKRKEQPMVVIKAEPKPKRQKPAKADGARNGKVAKAEPAKPASKPRKAGNGASKTQVVGDLLRRKDGCTGADVLAATGWSAVSMPAMAAALGINLKRVKNPGEVTRYFAE